MDAHRRHWPTARRIRRRWRRWRISVSARPLLNCAARTTLNPVYRRLLKLALEELRLIEDPLGLLDQQMAQLLAHHRLVRSPRLCRLIWKILHQGFRYEERGPALTKASGQARARKMIRELRSLGYRVELLTPPSGNPA